MRPRRSSNVKSAVLAGLALLPSFALAACADYIKRGDTVTAAAGDAQAHNKVVQIGDPWPPHSANTRIAGNGQRVDKATRRYLSGGNAAPAGGASISFAPQTPAPSGAPDQRPAQ